ncbi:MAG TPA: hypothetical protein VJ063_18990 [Verrucomicrobiae bacterium]|nr:hypothetical protein [Verrucomicrobiae bacterium]
MISSAGAQGVTLDWDSQTWVNNPDGTPAPNSYEIDSTHTGTDVTITAVGNNGAVFQQDIGPGTPQTPAVGQTFQGGLGTTQNTLILALNLANNTQSVTITLTFSPQYTSGISNLTFTLFDIDYASASGNTYQDQLTNIKGLAADGITWIAPTITTSATNTRTGTGLGQVVTGTASANDTGTNTGAGNVTISFGANAITAFTFTYGSGAEFANPTFQHVGLYDFSFTPVPELNPVWSALGSCVLAAVLILRHSAKFRK